MTNKEKIKGALEKVKPMSMESLLEKSTKDLQKVLPKHMNSQRLIGIALSCIRQTPELAKCNPASFVGALLASAQLGIEPLAGRAYILPFWSGKAQRKEAQFIMGYRGLVELFYRHQKSVQLNWSAVYENDFFEFEYGTKAYLIHRPTMKDAGAAIAYYVMAELQGGAKPFMVMSREKCLEHGKEHSKTYDKRIGAFLPSSPWHTDSDSMCCKTVFIQLGKLLPLSIELQQAIMADETSREYREGIDNILDVPVAKWGAEEAKIKPKKEEKPEPEYEVKPTENLGLYLVTKKDGVNITTYAVDMEKNYCTCPARKNVICKHILMVEESIKGHKKAEPTSPPKKTKTPHQQAVSTPKQAKKSSAFLQQEDDIIIDMQRDQLIDQIYCKTQISIKEIKEFLPAEIKNWQWAELTNYLRLKKKVNPEEFMIKLAEIMKGGERK